MSQYLINITPNQVPVKQKMAQHSSLCTGLGCLLQQLNALPMHDHTCLTQHLVVHLQHLVQAVPSSCQLLQDTGTKSKENGAADDRQQVVVLILFE